MQHSHSERAPIQNRQNLIDATLEIVSQQGCNAVSEPRVCEIARLTRGGLRHHFPTGRYGLLAALAEGLFDTLPVSPAKTGKDRALQLLDFLAERPEENPLVILMEIWFASRTDLKLREAIQSLFSTHMSDIFAAGHNSEEATAVMPYRFMLQGAILYVYGGDYEKAQLKRVARLARHSSNIA